MQATVKAFDSDTGSGSVLLDDGREVAFTAEAFALSGLRLLRSGQRVRLRIANDLTIEALTISTLDFLQG